MIQDAANQLELLKHFCKKHPCKECETLMKERKKFWLAPLIIVLLLLGILIVFGGGSAIAPFIYTLF